MDSLGDCENDITMVSFFFEAVKWLDSDLCSL